MFKSLLSLLFCFSGFLTATSQCDIISVTASPMACEGNYFFASINLEVDTPHSPGFTLAGNGQIYGTFLYADLPVTVGPLLGDDESVYEFIAWDVENSTCQNFTTLEASNCGPICNFSNPELVFLQCVSQNSAQVTFDFDYSNVSGPNFDLFYENGSEVSIGSWLYESLPLTIPFFVVSGAAPIVLTICDHENEDCCETFSFDAIDCSPDNCEIVNMIVDPNCTGNNFLVHVDFTYSNPPSDSFTLTGNSLNYGTFGYNELPITLGPLNGSSNLIWEFFVQDTENPNCQETEVLGVYHCPPPCNMEAIAADVFACTSDSTYSVELGIEIEGEGDLGFAVFSESYFYGNHDYDDLPLIIENLDGTGEYVDQVTICDNDNPGCCSELLYQAFLCAGCLIEDIVATPQPCDAEDSLMVLIDFYYYNISSSGFEVTGNGDNYGTFLYEDLPIEVGPFPGDGSVYLEFVITDLEDIFCFSAIEVGEVSCNEICELSNLVVDTGDCTGDDTYVAHIDFDHQGTTGIGFDLFVNGVLYDFYSYDDLPLTIEEFPSSGTGVDVITVCENDNNMCCATIEFAAPDCACSIHETTVQYLNCTSDSTFAIALEFFRANTPNNNVDIFLDGVYWGLFNAETIPVIIEDVPEGDGVIVVTICAGSQSDCCDEVLVEQDSCASAECNIWDLFAETGDCSSDSTYLLDFSFNHMHLPNDSITVTANGNYIGQYLIHPDFNRIENFPVLENDTVHLLICAAGAPDCCEDITYIAPNCSLFGQCHIYDLVIDFGDCQSDSTYRLDILFEYQNLPTDSVVVTANGNILGTYHVNGGHLTFFDFPEYETNHTVLTVCAQGAPDCCDVLEFETPNCGENFECTIWDLVAIIGDCQSDSTYILHIEFNFDNLPVDSVLITANGNEIGQFQVHEGSIFIENFPAYGTIHTVLSVCAAGAPDCCAIIEFETPNCEGGGTCHLFDLVADPGECLTDSTYTLFVHYFTTNFPGDSVIVVANEQIIGIYPHNPEGFVIEHFPEFNSGVTHITVCALNAPDCCDTFEFLTLNCGENNECNIVDLVADFGECLSDSTITLFIHYVALNLPGDSVVISTNEEVYVGTFLHNPDGFTIQGFPISSGNHTIVRVCALGSPDCCDVLEFETPDCGQGVDCHFHELFAEVGECTSDSTYVLDVVFNLVNAPGDSVLIYAGDSLVGQFFNDPEYIHIENFPHLPGEHTTVTVCAVGNPDCCASYTFETPFCTSECVIYDINVNVFDCTSDSTFGVVVNFDYQNINAGGFDLYAGDTYLGFFNIENVPIEFGQFPSNESGNYVLTICESDNEECCASQEFNGPICNGELCHIFDLTYTMTECDSNGHFFFIFDFEFNNVGNEGFHINGNGNEYGNFGYDDLPIQLGPFEDNGQEWEFVVVDNQHPDCSDSVVPGDVECNVSADIVLPEDYFQVFNNGTIPGILAKNNIRLSIFHANGHVIEREKAMAGNGYYELTSLPDGFYIGMIQYGDYVWPVKLIKTGY